MKPAWGLLKRVEGSSAVVDLHGQEVRAALVGGHPGSMAIPVAFSLQESSRLAVAIGLRSSAPRAYRPKKISRILQHWPTSQGPLGLLHLSEVSGAPMVESPAGIIFAPVPSVGGADLLGLVAFPLPGSESAALAVYSRMDAGDGNLQNVLSAHLLDGTPLWYCAVGEAYSIPGWGTQDNAVGSSQTWLSYDDESKAFWVVGHGTLEARKSVFVVGRDGSLGQGHRIGVLLSQCTAGKSAFIKGWHSRRGTTGREEDHPDLIGLVFDGQNFSNWGIDPQTILPGLQIATSAVEVRGGAICPEGRWPITSDGNMVFWISGSRKMINGKINVIMQLYQDNSSTNNMCGAANTSEDDVRTQEHRACLCAINVKTGEVSWRRDWSYSASHIVDDSALNGWLAWYPEPVPGTSGVQYYAYRGLVDNFYSDSFSFSGFANALSLNLQPVEVTDLPTCSIPNPHDPPENHQPVYGTLTAIVFPWHGPGWGSGFGAEFQLSACGTWIGPVYDWFQPGHPCLLPLPPIVGFGDIGPQLSWPVNQHTKRLDPVGGCICEDSNGQIWHAHMAQSGAVLDDFRLQAQYVSHSETFVPPFLATACGQWTDRVAHWTAHAVGLPTHHPILRLCCTGRGGEQILDLDITQYFRPQVVGGGVSSVDRGALANVWQIVPIPSSDVLLVVRDWFGQYNDDGNLENLPYPVIEVRDYYNPENVLQRIMLTEDLSTYNSETDPEADPVLSRVIDQYASPSCLSAGKGAPFESVTWVQWSHLCQNRQDNSSICNRIQLVFSNGSQVPTVNRWSNAGLSVPDSRNKLDTLVVVGDSSSWIDGGQFGSDYFVTVVS